MGLKTAGRTFFGQRSSGSRHSLTYRCSHQLRVLSCEPSRWCCRLQIPTEELVGFLRKRRRLVFLIRGTKTRNRSNHKSLAIALNSTISEGSKQSLDLKLYEPVTNTQVSRYCDCRVDWRTESGVLTRLLERFLERRSDSVQCRFDRLFKRNRPSQSQVTTSLPRISCDKPERLTCCRSSTRRLIFVSCQIRVSTCHPRSVQWALCL